jgi:hypothetical protein
MAAWRPENRLNCENQKNIRAYMYCPWKKEKRKKRKGVVVLTAIPL